MALSTEDRQELREIINDNMVGIHARTEAKFDIIDAKLNGVNGRLDKINGSVLKHAQDIEEIKTKRDIKYTQLDDYMNSRATGCPQVSRIVALETQEKIGISKKQLIISILSILAIVVSIAVGALKINESWRQKELAPILKADSTLIINNIK